MSCVRSRPRVRAVLALAIGLATVCAAAQAANAPLTVRVEGGRVRGALSHGVIVYKGIPYASAPRWAAPQPVKPWRGVRSAMRFGPDCMQLPTPGDMAPLRTRPAEKCLYVNVWRPARSTRGKLPVMVWIYGGGFVDGGTSPAVYDGSAFARDGVILVSFNYRLGNFGFFAFPALVRRGLSAGDFAFMDQIAALKWVRRNIGAFGGDAHNVTVFGESAGGMSVNALLISPRARGLFQKAIIESGAGRRMYPPRPLTGGPRSAALMGVRLARHLGIRGEGQRALDALRALPAMRVLDGLNMATQARKSTYVGGPIVDDALYYGQPVEAYARGMGARVPVMIGANSADLGSASAHSLAALFAAFGPDAAAARAAYDPKGDLTLQQVSSEIGGDREMVEPARAIARILAGRGQSVYAYRFSYVASSMRRTWRGAPHATEIPFVFGTLRAHYGAQTSRADEAMASAMHRYWVAFARTGRPDPAGEPAWGTYHAGTDRLMNFTEHGPVFERDPRRVRLDLTERAVHRGRSIRRERRTAQRPATWRTYDMIVDLDQLPRTYTCDELWYEFRGVLLRLGAPAASLSILPYRCSASVSADMRSPRVEVRFKLPHVLSGPEVKWAQLSAVSREIRFQPGRPKTLKPDDCQLLRQIRENLFDYLPVRLQGTDLNCRSRRRLFSLTLRAWVAGDS